eukprot:12832526-Prorocentrum_lima.AAC.1
MTFKVNVAAAQGESAMVYQLAKFTTHHHKQVIPSLCNSEGVRMFAHADMQHVWVQHYCQLLLGSVVEDSKHVFNPA